MPNRARGVFFVSDLLKPRRTQPNLRADPRSLRLLLFFDLLFVTLQGSLKLRIPSPKPFATSGIFLPPNNSTATPRITRSSGKPSDLMRPPSISHCMDYVQVAVNRRHPAAMVADCADCGSPAAYRPSTGPSARWLQTTDRCSEISHPRQQVVAHQQAHEHRERERQHRGDYPGMRAKVGEDIPRRHYRSVASDGRRWIKISSVNQLLPEAGVNLAPVRDNSRQGRHGFRRAAQGLGRYRQRGRASTCGCGVRRQPLHGAVPVPQREDALPSPSTWSHQFYKCFSCGAGGDVVKFVHGESRASASTRP